MLLEGRAPGHLRQGGPGHVDDGEASRVDVREENCMNYADLRPQAVPVSVLEDPEAREEFLKANVVVGLDEKKQTSHLFAGQDFLRLVIDSGMKKKARIAMTTGAMPPM